MAKMTTKSSSRALSILKVLAVVTLLTTLNAVSASTSTKVNTQLHALHFDRNDVSSHRFLRAATVQEERKLGVSLPGLGQAASSTKAWAANLIQKLQLKWWQLRKKSPNDVFVKLKLQQAESNLFESPTFAKWVTYVTKNSKDTPETEIFLTLAFHYRDAPLAKMLAAAKEVDSTRELWPLNWKDQSSRWIEAGKSPADVFTLLALEKAGVHVFSNPQFARWTNYIAQAKTADADAFIYRALKTYNSDDALVKMFAEAKKVDSTKVLATKMEGLQLSSWVNGKKSPDDLFKSLALDKAGTKAFEAPQFAGWTDFIAQTNTKNPDMAIYITLGTHYSDEALAKMFAAAKEADAAKALATRMEGIQLTNWVNGEKSPDQVFKILGLNKMGAEGFANPQFARWTELIATASTKDPNVAMFTTLAAHYSDDALARMLMAAGMVESTENPAANLCLLQFEKWFSQGKTPASVNTILGVTNNSDDLTKKISRDFEKFYGKREEPPAGPSSPINS
ncbi:secreted RxLR effector peptide protein, putative [Phytophthora infestans T30-4]|uniref:Secreted RxLR effector peptide protein, putative n=1 Tax=Phytophthora infestans (strain T30-4) TaxID=403677 RepID=D0NZW7_PHYIT|nr:secreted RxLR effector peptide protein, putative [Phytophthora infestans T30-4]EEY69683.1 secreted RxLR effector peptide protein, putative [Phytophthora infestans T30-4]|eukprot:XP_002997095.1 secreted RxLR effector peptide protein, putative [Phytophthora infestans T30-4]